MKKYLNILRSNISPRQQRQVPSSVSENRSITATDSSLTPYGEMLPYPNLVVCGAPRSGSSSLIYSLQEHPDLSFIGGRVTWTEAEGRKYGHPSDQPLCNVCRREKHLDLQKGGRRTCQETVQNRRARPCDMPSTCLTSPSTWWRPFTNPKILFILRNPVNRDLFQLHPSRA